MVEADRQLFLAAERTFLAWVRTGISIIGLGFVVSKFGLFLERLAASQGQTFAQNGHAVSGALGVAFVVLGSVCILAASVKHRRFVVAIPEKEIPAGYSKSLPVALAVLVAFLGICLAGYLLRT